MYARRGLARSGPPTIVFFLRGVLRTLLMRSGRGVAPAHARTEPLVADG